MKTALECRNRMPSPVDLEEAREKILQKEVNAVLTDIDYAIQVVLESNYENATEISWVSVKLKDIDNKIAVRVIRALDKLGYTIIPVESNPSESEIHISWAE